MPLLEINRIRHLCASVRRDEIHATHVDQYAAFIQASSDDVVDKALNYVFSKDRDFQEFLKTPQAKQVASALRVRKDPSNAAVEESAKEPAKKFVAGRESTAFRACGEGVTLPSMSWCCQNGASHRKNFDTPPLGGNCGETCGYSGGTILAFDR